VKVPGMNVPKGLGVSKRVGDLVEQTRAFLVYVFT